MKDPASPAKFSSTEVKLYRGLVFCVLLFVTSGALSIPFIYESQTLWYKIGIAKTLLRGGQMAGLLAAILVCVQVVVAARGAFLIELFGLAALMRWHRVNGIIVCFFALCHVFFVLAPEGLTNLPIGVKYWPEMVGILLFLLILLMVISSKFRQKLGFDYKRWRLIHKVLGYLLIVFLAVHVLFVCDTFEQMIPRVALFAGLIGVVVSVYLSKRTTG